jgi:hypothetical protein
MKVYPASRSRQRCIDAVAALEVAGHEVTHNWATGPACSYTSADAAIAATDVMAVKRAQVLLLLWEEGMLGANVEFGVALGLGKRIIVVGWLYPKGFSALTQGDRNVFYHLPQVVHVASLSDAILVLNDWHAQEVARG